MTAPPSASRWFEDPAMLERELRAGLGGRRAAPVIPGYVEVREIARGGQGVVYSAVQTSTRRRVAIKVIHDAAMDSARTRRRFEREIDLVAQLNHPGIVRVYDSGMTSELTPRRFLVMEFVEGVPLDEWAIVRSEPGAPAWGTRPLREVVEVLAAVAEAVLYAHQRGVIHRDLKPSNIRVDADSKPRVLDFGLAKPLLGEGSILSRITMTGLHAARHAGAATTVIGDAGASTHAREGNAGGGGASGGGGGFIGSLPWASPEQAAGDQSAMDLRSDVYALGVVIFQTLTGSFPYDVTGRPVRTGAAGASGGGSVSGLRAVLENIAAAEPVKLRSIRPQIDIDLETIVLKCLAKDPARRQQSAGELSADLRAWLAGEPIQARRDSAWYTIRTRVARYRTLAAAAGSVALMALAALAVSVGFYRDAVRQGEAARAARDEADAVSTFMQRVFTSIDPSRAQGREVLVRDAITDASAALNERTVSNAAARATIESTLGQTFAALGDAQRGEKHLLASIQTLRAAYGDLDQRTLLARAQLLNFLNQGEQYDRSSVLVEELRKDAATLGDAGRETLAMCDASEAWIAHGRGEYARAEPLYRRAIAELSELSGPDDEEVLNITNSLAVLLDDMGRSQDALALTQELADRFAARYGPLYPRSLLYRMNLGQTIAGTGDFARAEPILRAAADDTLRVLGPDHQQTCSARVLHATTLSWLEKNDEAIAILQDVMPRLERTLGEQHPQTRTTMNNLAMLLMETKQFDTSIEVFERALELSRQFDGPTHPRTLQIMHNLAGTYGEVGQVERSLQGLREVAQLREQTLGPDSRDSIISQANVARTLVDLGQAAEAEPMLRTVIERGDRAFPAGHYAPAVFRVTHGRALTALGMFEQAERELLAGRGRLAEVFGQEHGRTRSADKAILDLYRRMGDETKAAAVRARLGE